MFFLYEINELLLPSIVCFLLVLSIINFFLKDNLVTDLLDQLRLQLSWVIFFVSINLIFINPLFCFFGIVLFVFNFYKIYSSFHKYSKKIISIQNPIKKIKILSYNLYNKNKSPDLAYQLILKTDADLVLLLESYPNFSPIYSQTLDMKYPYRFPSENYKNPHRLEWVLHSKFPILNSDLEINKNLPFSNHRILHAKIQLEGEIVHFLGIHTRSPKSKKWLKSRNDYFRKLPYYIKQNIPENAPYIVAGDMNTTPWNTEFNEFQKVCFLTNTDTFFTIKKTWPNKFLRFFRFPIDHILFSKHFCCVKKVTLSASGSDHLPIYAELNRLN